MSRSETAIGDEGWLLHFRFVLLGTQLELLRYL